ncbi:unnamed protein product [Euphydryas editha]|uniref:Endonuclease/exonuclease/phosphatase domain-containing protein n=1 Tax=Euphydryas editha TaxID=104508 RepID=A0AAU9TRJ2_EUPED|nr:unnamed protein product [Euphydryas editha]
MKLNNIHMEKKENKNHNTKAAPQAHNRSVAPTTKPAAPQGQNLRVAPIQQTAAPQAHNLGDAPTQQPAAPQVSSATGILDLTSLEAAMPTAAQPWQVEPCWNLVTVKKREAKKQKTKPAQPAPVRKAPGVAGSAAPVGVSTPSEVGATAAACASKSKRTRRGKKRTNGKNHEERPTQTKPVKRDRPDDSFTPQGNGKRRKPTNTTGPIKYADALKMKEYCVAIMMEPYHDLTKEQAEAIEKQLQRVMDEEIFSPSTSATPVVAPSFRGKAFHSEGTLKMWCEDDFTLQWLQRNIVKVTSPRAGTRLVVRKQSEIPKRVKAGLLIPQVEPEDDLDRIRLRITCQNPKYRVSNWALYSAVPTEDRSAIYLILGIPEDDAQKLKASERRIHYKFGNIYARFQEDRTTALSNLDAAEVVPTDTGNATTKMEESQPGPSKEPVVVDIGSSGTAMMALPTPPETHLSITQINLQHSQTATANLRRLLEGKTKTVALIQEPWIGNGRICGLSNIGGKLLLNNNIQYPRTCIYAHRDVNITLITEFCNRDLITVKLRKEPSSGLSDVVLASTYLPGDADIPTPELAALVEYCERQGLELIISVDSNAHHELWGSKDNNQRGEDFVSFLLATNLNVINKGSEPTFVTSRSQTIIDLTLATEHVSSYISDWHVSDDVSGSDHRWIKFNLVVTLTPPEPRRNPRKMDRGRYGIQTAQKLKGVELPDNHEHTTDIDNHINQVTNCLITSFEQTCPLSTPKTRQLYKKHWWGPELEKLRRKVRKLFNKARNTRAEHHWDAYKQAQYHYKKRIRFRKRECWRRFCTNIETNNQANRVKNVLCSEPMHTLGCLKKPDGTYTKTDLETSELLITTHFPGCQIKERATWEEEQREPPETVDLNTAKEIITHDKVIWAINSFLPYKSAGLDGVFPGLLRWSDRKLIDHLVSIYRSCLAFRYTPKVWREVKVVFIPKPGKGDYSQPKSFRPISLTSFLLKVLERIIDRELRSTTLVEQPLNPSTPTQQANQQTLPCTRLYPT